MLYQAYEFCAQGARRPKKVENEREFLSTAQLIAAHLFVPPNGPFIRRPMVVGGTATYLLVGLLADPVTCFVCDGNPSRKSPKLSP
jgi:hypothetical protein